MWSVHRYSDSQSFLNRAEKWLLQKEAEHNIILSVSYLLTGDSHFQEPIYLATVEEDAEVCGCVVRAPPDGLYVTDMPIAAVSEIVHQLQKYYQELPEVIGPESVATEFAKKWKLQKWKMHSHLRWYSVSEVIAPKRVAPGFLRKAGSEDIPLVSDWASSYAREVATKVDVVIVFQRMVRRGLLHLWDDDGPRCVITASGLTPNAARISSLYTPPEYRGRGYAANAVASVSQQILNSGRQLCVTAADVNEPGPTAIYKSVGYRSSEEIVLIQFD
jgi:predicted GNAT family acetyltransferase